MIRGRGMGVVAAVDRGQDQGKGRGVSSSGRIPVEEVGGVEVEGGKMGAVMERGEVGVGVGLVG